MEERPPSSTYAARAHLTSWVMERLHRHARHANSTSTRVRVAGIGFLPAEAYEAAVYQTYSQLYSEMALNIAYGQDSEGGRVSRRAVRGLANLRLRSRLTDARRRLRSSAADQVSIIRLDDVVGNGEDADMLGHEVVPHPRQDFDAQVEWAALRNDLLAEPPDDRLILLGPALGVRDQELSACLCLSESSIRKRRERARRRCAEGSRRS